MLKRCTSCFACNFICPNGCNPAQRIMDIWHERSVQHGLPERARYYLPDADLNFRTYVVDRLPPEEKALVKSWEDTSPCREIFYPGCNIITVPHITQTRLLDGFTIRGSLKLCCGETYYRTGQYEMAEKAARRINAWQEQVGFEKMVIPCTAGRNMFTNVLPKLGLKRNFEVEHLLPRLLERFENGEIEIKQRFEKTVTLQESCYGKCFGDDFMDVPRALLRLVGATVVEEDLNRERALCCGIGGGFSFASGYHPWDIALSTMRTLNLAKKTGAEALVCYCAGCLQMLSVGQIVWPNRMPVYHLLEVLSLAIGEQPARRHRQRALTMFQGVVRNQGPALLSGKRLYLKDYL